LIEAMAYDVAIVTSKWRAIPGMLPSSRVTLVDPKQPDEIARAVSGLCGNQQTRGALRAHFLAHFTRERHLATLKEALRSLG
jgi:glycosyltransferase involved in cell wall biosynthesis